MAGQPNWQARFLSVFWNTSVCEITSDNLCHVICLESTGTQKCVWACVCVCFQSFQTNTSCFLRVITRPLRPLSHSSAAPVRVPHPSWLLFTVRVSPDSLGRAYMLPAGLRGLLWSAGASINPLSRSIIRDHLSYAWLHGCRALLPQTAQWLTLSSNKKVLGSRPSHRLHVLWGFSPGTRASSKSPESLWCAQFHIMLWIQLIQLLWSVLGLHALPF